MRRPGCAVTVDSEHNLTIDIDDARGKGHDLVAAADEICALAIRHSTAPGNPWHAMRPRIRR